MIGQTHLRVLGVGEEQFFLARFFHQQVDGSRFSREKLSGLDENHFQKSVQILFRYQGAAHLMETFHVQPVSQPLVSRVNQG